MAHSEYYDNASADEYYSRYKSILQDKNAIIENLRTRYDLGILKHDPNIKNSNDGLTFDEMNTAELRRKCEAIAQLTILENMELREIINDLRDENFRSRNDIYELQDKINRLKLRGNGQNGVFHNLYRTYANTGSNSDLSLAAKNPFQICSINDNQTELSKHNTLTSICDLIKNKDSIIQNLLFRYDLGVTYMTQVNFIAPDEIEMEDLCRKAEALAHRTILENFELREMSQELKQENFGLVIEKISMSASPFERLNVQQRTILMNACFGEIEKEITIPIDIKTTIAWHCGFTDEWNETYMNKTQIRLYGTFLYSLNTSSMSMHMNTFYGQRVLCNGVYKWRLRLVNLLGEKNISVGFIKNKLDVLEKFEGSLYANEWFLNGNGYVYCGADMDVGYNSTFCKANKAFKHYDDVLEITLDLNQLQIYLSVNGEKSYVPETLQCIDKDEYRLAITMPETTAIQLV